MRYALLGSLAITLPFLAWKLMKRGKSFPSGAIFPKLQVILLIAISTSVFKPIFQSIVFEPIHHWDARCVWYYHAKHIYEENAINRNSGFSLHNEFNRNAHPYYPKLVSATGAYLSKAYGFWNEYLPKTNLLVLMAAFLFAIISATAIPIAVRFFFPFLFVGFNTFWFSTGYIDPWLGMFVGTLIVFLVSYLGSRKPSDLLSCVLTGFLLLNFKNESIIALVSLVCASTFVGWLLFRKDRIRKHIKLLLMRNWAVLLVAALPFVIWSVEKRIWHLPPLVGFDPSKILDFAIVKKQLSSDRVPIAYDGYIRAFSYGRMIILSVAALGGSLLYFYFRRNHFYKKAFLAAHLIPFLSFFIFAGLFVLSMIVTITIDDIAWYVATGADRIYSTLFMMAILPVLSLIYSTANVVGQDSLFPLQAQGIVKIGGAIVCVGLTAYFSNLTFKRNAGPEPAYSTSVNFKSMTPAQPGSYNEQSLVMPALDAGDAVTLEITPEWEIKESMNAHVILMDPSDWQNTLVFHNHIQGAYKIKLSGVVAKAMPAPLLTYRNWQDTLAIPPVRVEMRVYHKPERD